VKPVEVRNTSGRQVVEHDNFVIRAIEQRSSEVTPMKPAPPAMNERVDMTEA